MLVSGHVYFYNKAGLKPSTSRRDGIKKCRPAFVDGRESMPATRTEVSLVNSTPLIPRLRRLPEGLCYEA
jgi:hypothetical protein